MTHDASIKQYDVRKRDTSTKILQVDKWSTLPSCTGMHCSPVSGYLLLSFSLFTSLFSLLNRKNVFTVHLKKIASKLHRFFPHYNNIPN